MTTASSIIKEQTIQQGQKKMEDINTGEEEVWSLLYRDDRIVSL